MHTLVAPPFIAGVPTMEPDRDAQLMALCVGRDELAFEELVSRHATQAWGLAMRLLNDAQDAEDAVQVIFQKIWEHPEKWSPERGTPFLSWLKRVVVNKCLDMIRKRKPTTDISGLDIVDETPDFPSKLDQDVRLKLLHAAIDKLPARQKAAVVLCYQEGHCQKEAMEILGIGEKALESLLSRAKSTLRKLELP